MAGNDLGYELVNGVPMVTLVIDDDEQGVCYPLRVPGSSQEEGWHFLESLGSGAAGGGMRQMMAGATWEPIRLRYQAIDQALAQAAQRELAALGPKPSLSQLEQLVKNATGARTRMARLWRLPTGPDVALLAEARDWKKYGPGGRSFNNLLARSMNNAERATWSRAEHLQQMLRNVEKANPKVTAGVLRNARYLRYGGAFVFVAGLGWTAHEYSQTPVAQRRAFVERQGAGFVGGAVASGLAVALIISAPVSGLVVLGVALVAGVAGGMAGEGLYQHFRGQSLLQQAGACGVLSAKDFCR